MLYEIYVSEFRARGDEDVCSRLLRNLPTCLPNLAASHPGRLICGAASSVLYTTSEIVNKIIIIESSWLFILFYQISDFMKIRLVGAKLFHADVRT